MNSKAKEFLKAISKGDFARFSLLLNDPQLDVNCADVGEGQTFLEVAMEEGYDAMVKALLGFKGFRLEQANKAGETPLFVAIRLNQPTYVAWLVQSGASPHIQQAPSEGGGSEPPGGDPQERAKSGAAPAAGDRRSALREAIASKCHPEIIGRLAQDKQLLNEAIHPEGSYLNLASAVGEAAAVEALLRQGAEWRTADAGRNTCLHLAAAGGFGDVLQALLARVLGDELVPAVEKEFFLNEQNRDGNTALHEAWLRGHATLAERLQREGAAFGLSVRLRNKKGQTAQDCEAEAQEQRRLRKEAEELAAAEKLTRRRAREEEKARRRQEELAREQERQRGEKRQLRLTQFEREALGKLHRQKTLWRLAIVLAVVFSALYFYLSSVIRDKAHSAEGF